MRLVLRFSMLLVVAGLSRSQGLTEAAGLVGGGSVGAGGGKKVGQGVAAVLQNVNTTASKAAKPSAKTDGAVLQTGPGGVVKDHSLVPPPPPKKVVAVVPPPPPLTPSAPAVLTPKLMLLPPHPQATAEDLKTLASGTSRAEVLKLGMPSSRVTMFDDGHLVEIFRYQTRDVTFGVVRLSDGSVSNVQVR